ncbi:MAG: BspA family leucine-rich repeat surface protein [Oscillospiraceae bacterium]|nr:BspA family leucine-rich repeat surface protein [Oscillospiraceae bacterium]
MLKTVKHEMSLNSVKRIIALVMLFMLVFSTSAAGVVAIAEDENYTDNEQVVVVDEEFGYDYDEEIGEEEVKEEVQFVLSELGEISIMPLNAIRVSGNVGIGGAPWRLYENGSLYIDSGSITFESLNPFRPWDDYTTYVNKITITGSITASSSITGLFRNLTNLEAINGLDYFDTYNVTSMGGMFQEASGLTSLDLSSWDTSNVTSMMLMFGGASGLTSLDVSGWDTSSVRNMGMMFHGISLTSLDLSSWDTSNVGAMNSMFTAASGLTSLDLSSWDTSSVTNMNAMFHLATGLESLDLSGWDTGSVTNTGMMFRSATRLESLDVSHFDTHSVTNMWYMFEYASSLTSLDLSNWDTSNVTTMRGMFANASSLESLDLSGWDTSNVNTMWNMFLGTTALRELSLGANFTFVEGNLAHLPPVLNNATYTGFWVHTVSGETRTSAQIMANNFTPGTWIWQQRSGATTTTPPTQQPNGGGGYSNGDFTWQPPFNVPTQNAPTPNIPNENMPNEMIIDDIEVPLAEEPIIEGAIAEISEAIEIEETIAPPSNVPQTGITDNRVILIVSLLMSLTIAIVTASTMRRPRAKANR